MNVEGRLTKNEKKSLKKAIVALCMIIVHVGRAIKNGITDDREHDLSARVEDLLDGIDDAVNLDDEQEEEQE